MVTRRPAADGETATSRGLRPRDGAADRSRLLSAWRGRVSTAAHASPLPHRLHRPGRVRPGHPAAAVLRRSVSAPRRRQVTILFAVYSLVSMLTAPLWGRLSDRIGRRPVLMASTITVGPRVSVAGLRRLSCGCCSRRAPWPGACAGNIAAAQAYIADVTHAGKPRPRHGHDRRRVRARLYHRAGAGRRGRRQRSGAPPICGPRG